jgi:hypothetical protein
MSKTDNEKLEEFLADIDDEIVIADGLAHAFVGLTNTEHGVVAVYSTERIIANLRENDAMDFETAEEYMHFNIIGANVGQRTPVFVDVIPEEFWK